MFSNDFIKLHKFNYDPSVSALSVDLMFVTDGDYDMIENVGLSFHFI